MSDAPPIDLLCTVRGCGRALRCEGASLRCCVGHSFDRAREGYWNLLQPQDRRSRLAGDAPGAVAARRRWLERGFADSLFADLAAMTAAAEIPESALVVDVGCGEGTIARRLFAAGRRRVCGIDLSVRAIALAARAYPEATWVVANADRAVPLADGSAHLLLSLFGRRNGAECLRVLAPGGRLLVAVPAADDLAELREAVQGAASRRERLSAVIASLEPGFEPIERRTWRVRAEHDSDALRDLLAMTYRGARFSEQGRLASLERLDVTLAAELLMFCPSRPP